MEEELVRKKALQQRGAFNYKSVCSSGIVRWHSPPSGELEGGLTFHDPFFYSRSMIWMFQRLRII
jgi:hypothetical protein